MDKLKLLYVDDEKANLTNFKIAFKRYFQILTAEDGQAALDIFKENIDIAIVVADQRMPVMKGVDLLAEIKNIDPDVIRIILTAYTDTVDIIDSINKGHIYQYVIKPWVESDLVQVLNNAKENYQLVKRNKKLLQELDEKNKELEADIDKRRRIEAVLLKRDMVLDAINVMASLLLLNKDWQRYVDKLMERMGMVMEVSRVRIFQYHIGQEGANVVNLKFEWANIDLESCLDDPRLQEFSADETYLGRFEEMLQKGETVYGGMNDLSDEEKPWLQQFGIVSFVIVPIMVDKKCWGFISFSDLSRERTWQAAELDVLKTAASFLGTAIEREALDKKILAQQAQLAHAGRLTSLGEMASGIGHEIHQPLTVINLGAETCKSYFEGCDPQSPAAEAADEMRVQVRKITQIIKSMQTFSRVSSGKMKKINIIWPLHDSLVFFREQFRQHMIEYKEVVLDDLPLVKTDSQKLEQIIVNLLSNARYSVDKMVQINPDLKKRITVTLSCKNVSQQNNSEQLNQSDQPECQFISFEVADNGLGMSESVRNRCLEPFFTTKEVGEGTGLGLSVSHAIMKELNCRLEIDSVEGEGSVFRLLIPVEEEDRID
ncbi:MAG: response regulator [Desulfobulbaceae bacterium]|nr:response regulator [Desulfobulbaceae bacterium]